MGTSSTNSVPNEPDKNNNNNKKNLSNRVYYIGIDGLLDSSSLDKIYSAPVWYLDSENN